MSDNGPYAKKVRSHMFQPEGPLGTFGAQIDMAYLIGLLSEKGHEDLLTFKKVRNLFAHYAEHNTFDTERIRALCKNFRLIDEHKRIYDQVIWKRDTPEEKFEATVDAVVIERGVVTMGIKKADDDTASPKWRFLASSKLFCATLDIYLEKPQDLLVPLL